MKFRALVGVLLSLAVTQATHAVTLTISPNVVSNDYNGLITLQVSGLPAGETVQLVQHYDLNGNGTIDAQDVAVRAETISDGDARLFGTNVNINLVRDEDGATNGSINATFRLQFAPYFARTIGKYVFACVSPSNDFATVTAPFTVNNAAYGQTVSGSVTCGTNIPNARVALFVPDGTDAPRFVMMGTADATGHYSLNCPAGTYTVAAFQSGYVGNLTNFPQVVVSAGANPTVNVPLTAATRTLTGSVNDSASTLLHPIPCAEVMLKTANLDATIAQCDTNGNFTARLTSATWSPIVTSQSAQSQGYMVPDPETLLQYDLTSGDVSGAVAFTAKGTALLYGRIIDNNSNAIPNADLFANADFGQYDAFGMTDSNGNYAIAIDSGFGNISLIYSAQAPLNNYVWPSAQFSINNGDAVNVDIIGHVATAHIRCRVTDNFGTPISGAFAVADSYDSYGVYTSAVTDNNGYADIGAYGGTWDFSIYSSESGLVFPNATILVLTDGVNVTNNVVAQRTTGNISGYITDNNGAAISSVPVILTNRLGSTNFTIQVYTDSSGYYSADVFNGTWNVWAYLEGVSGYSPVPTTNVVVPPATNIVNFVAQVIPPPTILTTSLPEGFVSQYYGTVLEATNGAYPLTWIVSAGSLPTGLSLDYYGYISGTPTIAGTNNFTLTVTDARGSNNVKALSIIVRSAPTGPPTILSTYFNDAAIGCSYSNMLKATDGAEPYTWTLVSGSTMPPGLSLDPSGIISGVPATNDYFNFTVQCTGSDNNYATQTIYFTVNDVLTLYPSPLPAGSVGASYFGSLYTSGGAQPQTWSVISGALPDGLMLSSSSGYITGAPTTVGVSQFTLRVSDGCTVIDTPTSITNYPTLKFVSTNLPVGQPNVAYNAQVQVTGGLPPYYFSIYGSIPYGLTGNADGTITGTPYYESTNTVTCYVYDAANNSIQQDFTLIISAQAAPTPPSLDLPSRGGNGFTFRVTGSSGQNYTLQSTVDLTNWSDVFTTNAPSDVFYMTDTNTISGHRVYRLQATQ